MTMNQVKTPSELSAQRESGQMLALVLKELASKTEPGLTPQDMSSIARKELKALGGEPAFLGYYGFPDVVCISVNEQVQHGIPNRRPFQAGDVVNYDFGVKYKGMITDGGISLAVDNKTTPDTERLLKGTKKALDQALKVVRHGCRVGDISATIERTLRKFDLSIVYELAGHGVGHKLHEDPEIPNQGREGTGAFLKAGMTVAIEPITTLGSPAIVEAADGWTLLAIDGSWSAQFEHTVLVTPNGCEVLTQI